jgi:hypothetical protein
VTIAIYSAIYGGYNEAPPLPPDLPCPAIMYTDDPELKAPGWEVRMMPHGLVTLKGDPRRTGPMLQHKWWKMFAGRGEVDITIWLDASMTITAPGEFFPELCLEALGEPDIWLNTIDLVVMRHPWRTCIYDEAAYSSLLPRYEHEAPHILAQAAYYAGIAHPDHWGLIATGFYVRRNGVEWVDKLMKDWWWECISRSHQDQISLPVLLKLAGQDERWDYRLPWHDGPDSWTHLGHHLK